MLLSGTQIDDNRKGQKREMRYIKFDTVDFQGMNIIIDHRTPCRLYQPRARAMFLLNTYKQVMDIHRYCGYS